MSLTGKLKVAAGITVAAVGFHAYQSGVAATPAHHGGRAASVAAVPAARGGSNEALANQMAAGLYGWRGGQASCLDALWTEESAGTWSPTVTNPTSGAYGIPQSLPAGKMASAGADWRTNPATQVKWGLGYIHDRYGSPCAAWQHEKSQTPNWY